MRVMPASICAAADEQRIRGQGRAADRQIRFKHQRRQAGALSGYVATARSSRPNLAANRLPLARQVEQDRPGARASSLPDLAGERSGSFLEGVERKERPWRVVVARGGYGLVAQSPAAQEEDILSAACADRAL